ncbi:hypothetical protein MACH10_32260 [Thalassospira tepidiphila]|jgi:hypothetical protein|nr:hypothetical protein MACH10_32260 [Thalassospira tepidiphila]
MEDICAFAWIFERRFPKIDAMSCGPIGTSSRELSIAKEQTTFALNEKCGTDLLVGA